MAAVVAGEQAIAPVQHERHVARRALPRPPARPARQEVRPAAAVEQHDRLAARRRARRGCAGAAPAAPRACRRSRPAAAPAPSTRAERRRRGSAWTLSGRGVALPATSTAPAVARPAHRHAARVVARVALVLVGGSCSSSTTTRPTFASGANTAERGPTQTRASPRRRRSPLVVALAVGELRVQDGDGVAEALHEPRDDLRRQRDLGDEHDHVAAGGERLGRRAQVDLGLARAGHAVQQEPLPRRGRADREQRGLLLGREGRPRARARRRRRARARGGRRAARSSGARGPPAAAARAVSGPVNRGSVSRSARWASVSRSPSCTGRAAAAYSAVLGRVPFGGSSSDSARAGVDAYSARHPQREVDEVGR